LQYICGTYDRFLAVAQVLSVMVNVLVEMQAVRLLKHVVRCYLRLSDHPKSSRIMIAANVRAREALKSCLPDPLRNASFAQVLKDDTSTKRCLAQLLYNLSDPIGPGGDNQI
jgi:CCR4-NOT transcription complex subunit 9